MRVVLDTDVVVAALRSPTGASAALLGEIDLEHAILLLSAPLALEYEAVCQGPEHRLATGLSAADTEAFVNTLIAIPEAALTDWNRLISSGERARGASVPVRQIARNRQD